MKKKHFFLFLCIFLFTVQKLSSKTHTEKITLYTAEEYPYQLKSGEGASYEILKEMYKMHNKSLPEVNFLLWNDAYNAVKTKKNTVIFTISRREDRESFFYWCCKLYEAPNKGVLTIRGSLIKSQADLGNKIGAVIKNDTSEFILNSLIKKDKTIKKIIVKNFSEALKLLLAKKVDFTVAKEPLLLDICFKDKLNCRGFIHVKTNIKFSRNNIYFAFNPLSSQKLIKEFRMIFDNFKKTKKYSEILKKYGVHIKDI